MQEITSFLDSHAQAMFDLLKELVCLQSYSLNKAGVDAVGRAVEKSLAGLPLSCTRHSHKVYGDHLVCTSPTAELARGTGKKIFS
jgi:glutamate carboxypeptidase